MLQEKFEMTKIELMRCIIPYQSDGDTMFLKFSDTSNDAYGEDAYAAWNLSNGTNEARLIAGKGRLATMKQKSVYKWNCVVF